MINGEGNNEYTKLLFATFQVADLTFVFTVSSLSCLDGLFIQVASLNVMFPLWERETEGRLCWAADKTTNCRRIANVILQFTER